MPRAEWFQLHCNKCGKIIDAKENRYLVNEQIRDNHVIRNTVRYHFHTECFKEIIKTKKLVEV